MLRWKETVGPIWSRPGHPNANWGYWSTDGLGLFEFMELAGLLGAEPVWVMNVGISHTESVEPQDLESSGWLQVCVCCVQIAVSVSMLSPRISSSI